MTQDQTDFVEMLADYNLTIAQYALECFERHGQSCDPRTVAAGLETVAKAADGWCIGRFGRFTA